MTAIIARYKCNLRNLRPSFLRNRPVRKVAETKQSVAIPSGATKETSEKELRAGFCVFSAAETFSLRANTNKIVTVKIDKTYDFISVSL